jgi:hypothetical protein
MLEVKDSKIGKNGFICTKPKVCYGIYLRMTLILRALRISNNKN